MAVIGILARIDNSRYKSLWETLEKRENVSPFPVENETGRIGILIERSPASEAYQILDSIRELEEIYALWPVYEHLEEESVSLNSNQSTDRYSEKPKETSLEEMPS